MDCRTIAWLLNREIDGRTSPEEEALLMQHVGECPDCARTQRLHLDLRAAFRGLPRSRCPEGLAARISDRVLASPFCRAARPKWPLLRNAAAIVMTAALAGICGWYAAQGEDYVVAGHPGSAAQEALRIEHWKRLGATAGQAADIIATDASFEARLAGAADVAEHRRINDEWAGAVLRLLSPEVRERYRLETGWSEAEVTRLLAIRPR